MVDLQKEWAVYNEDGKRIGYVYADTLEDACEEANKKFPGWDDIDGDH